MDSTLRLVRVYSADITALMEYIEALYIHDEDYDSMVNIEEGVKSLMRNEALACAYFIQRESEKIGYVILTKYHSVEKGGLTVFIDELYVEEKHRRHGVGKQIMKEIIGIAKDWGAKALWAQTEPHNDAAQAFFSSEGFQPNLFKNFERPL